MRAGEGPRLDRKRGSVWLLFVVSTTAAVPYAARGASQTEAHAAASRVDAHAAFTSCSHADPREDSQQFATADCSTEDGTLNTRGSVLLQSQLQLEGKKVLKLKKRKAVNTSRPHSPPLGANTSVVLPQTSHREDALFDPRHLPRHRAVLINKHSVLFAVMVVGIFVAAICEYIIKRNEKNDLQRECDHQSQSQSSRHPNLEHFMGQDVQEVECDYVLVFNSQHSTKGVPALEWAKEVLLCFRANPERLENYFTTQMPLNIYCATMRTFLKRMFEQPPFNMEINASGSDDDDEIFWQLRLPKEAVAEYAKHYEYMVYLNDFAYESRGFDVPVNSYHDKVYATVHYRDGQQSMYQEFKPVDSIKLIIKRIQRNVSLDALERQHVLGQHFAPHRLHDLEWLCKSWGNVCKWHRFPQTCEYEARGRNCFGEEVMWLFMWHRYYMEALLVPATLGAIVYMRHFLLPARLHYEVQICFAVVMGVWASVFNAKYARYEATTRQKWGMDQKPDTWHVQAYKDFDSDWQYTELAYYIMGGMGDVLTLGMMLLSIVGILCIQRINPENNDLYWVGLRSTLIAGQIVTLDYLWGKIAKVIVDMEGHKIRSAWYDSYIKRIFLVRIFNNLYPFIYVGFFKEFSVTGCPKTERGCIDELELNLCTYFLIRVLKDLALDTALFFYARLQVAKELLTKSQVNGGQMVFMQLQSKLCPYDDQFFIYDWTRVTTTFIFLLCFGVVLPAIGVLVLLITMIEGRLFAHRNSMLTQRPTPNSAQGIGGWQELLEAVEIIGVVVNVSFVVFAMSPVRDLEVGTKFLIFVVAEHAMLVIKFFVKTKFREMPREVQNISEHNNIVANCYYLDDTSPTERRQISNPSMESRMGSKSSIKTEHSQVLMMQSGAA